MVAILPGEGRIRLWVNGEEVERGQAVNSALSGGWSSIQSGSFAAAPQGAVISSVPVAARITPTEFSVIEPLVVYNGQLPKQFG